MIRRRAMLWLGSLLVFVAVGALGTAGMASGAENSNPLIEECNPDGRLFCIDVTTFSNITASDPGRADDGKRYTWVEFQMRNEGGSTLTHPAVTVTLTDYCGSVQCAAPNPTSAFVLPDSSNACALSGLALECTYANIPAGLNTGAFTRVYFKTADAPATHTVISVTGTVKERANDGNPCGTGDPNCDTFTTFVTNSYEPIAGEAYTYALTGKQFHLSSNDELSSFDFTSNSSSIFFAQFQVLEPSTDFCFGSVPCFDRTLFADTAGATGFGSTNPVVFYARLLDPPGGVTPKNLAAIHTYDATTLQVLSDRLTAAGTSFARMDGVEIGTIKYFVVSYQATGNSFQISLTKGGAPVSLADGAVLGRPIRIIGDQSDERSSKGCTTTFSSLIPVPSICAQKVTGQPKALDAWVWDLGNGGIQF